MSKETDELDYTDAIVDFFSHIREQDARQVALLLWRFYPNETQALLTSLIQTQHTKRLPKLLQK